MDLIKDRLAHIIRAKNLTATQFAEMMQIQPSNVSHLLSGRNKPSLDFLIKLKDVFPEYSFDWIILGKKPITINEPHYLSKEVSMDPDNEEKSYIKPPIDKQEDLFSDHDINIDKILHVSNSSNESKGLKQIIYIYEDNTFEVYNLRK